MALFCNVCLYKQQSKEMVGIGIYKVELSRVQHDFLLTQQALNNPMRFCSSGYDPA